MTPRKVAFLTPLYFDDESCIGGGERYPLYLAGGVVEASGGAYHVEIISYGDRPGVRTLRPGVTLRVLTPANRPAHPLDVVSWDLPEAIAGVDLVHIHAVFTRSNELGMLAAKQLRKPVVVTDHGGHSSRLGLEVGILELADRVTGVSQYGASLYKTTRPVVAVSGGVDARKFTPSPRPTPRDGVLFVGRLLPHKGVDRLIAALPAHVKLTICGRPYHAEYFAKLQADAAGKRVEFITDADDARTLELYRGSIATVLPSVYRDCYGGTNEVPELMGLVLLESMACGTPAICSRVGGMPEFVRHGETGYVFDELSELTGYLAALAAEPATVARMGQAARALVEREYSLEVVGARMVSIYRELIDAREARDRAEEAAA